MPTFTVNVPAGKFSREEKIALSDAYHRALMDAFGAPPGDRFLVINEYEEGSIFIDPHFPDMQRTDRAMFLQIIIGEQRTTDERRKLAQLCARYAAEAVGISQDDVAINMIPVPLDTFSFGRGKLQLAEGMKW